MLRHLAIGVLCLSAVTLPWDFAGVNSPWVWVAGVVAALLGMLGSAWSASRIDGGS